MAGNFTKPQNSSGLNHGRCSVGAYCSHAVLTLNLGVYRCPFGQCFKLSKQGKEGF